MSDPVPALCAALALACSSAPAPATSAEPRPAHPVAASAGATWDAVIAALPARGITIRTTDRAGGLVTTDELPIDLREADRNGWADCGRQFGAALAPNRGSFTIIVRGDSARSTVQAAAVWRAVPPGNTMAQPIACTSRGAWEAALEQDVKARAEAAAGR